MTKTLYILINTLVSAAFYCVLIERFMFIDVLIGLFIGLSSSLLFFKSSKVRSGFRIVLTYFVFVLKIILDIYKAAFKVIVNLFTETGTKIEKVSLTKDISFVMSANAYTLTPGSVALDMEGDNLYVIMYDNKRKRKI